jgi:MoxR-like ATPase
MNFNPVEFNPAAPGPLPPAGSVVHRPPGDAEGRRTYVYERSLILAINVALATGRPLLLAGEPGCGKTALAASAARVLRWPLYEHTIGSRSRASEMLWEIDTLRRLSDAYDTSRQVLPDAHYVQPGKLWWALAPSTAALRGLLADEQHPNAPPVVVPPNHSPHPDGAVLLIDEIDKAEPDVPNDLLDVLDTRSVTVLGRRIERERAKVLIVITTNLERELPGAFVRRCVVHRFPKAEPGWFVAIAKQRHPTLDVALAQQVEDQLMAQRESARERGQRLPGTAEYLDAIDALRVLGITATGGAHEAAWLTIRRCLFDKHSLLDE